jgi:hypothetical protein
LANQLHNVVRDLHIFGPSTTVSPARFTRSGAAAMKGGDITCTGLHPNAGAELENQFGNVAHGLHASGPSTSVSPARFIRPDPDKRATKKLTPKRYITFLPFPFFCIISCIYFCVICFYICEVFISTILL